MFPRLLSCIALVVFALASSSSASHAQFQVCNKSSHASIDVAFGRRRGSRGWESEGWFTVRRNQCTTLVARELRERYYYLFAETADTVWNGDDDNDGADFCIREREVFRLNDESLSEDGALACEKFGYVTKRFMQVDTEDHTEFTFDITD